MSSYQPGACNIGRDERRKRRRMGAVSFLAALGYAGYVLATGRPDAALLASFPLLFGGFVGVVQDRMRFCVAFGALARYDLTGSGGGAGRVGDSQAVRRDRLRAAKVLGVAAGLAAVATLAVYGLGVAL